VVQSNKLHLTTMRPITLCLLTFVVKLHQCILAMFLHMSLYKFQPMSIMSSRIRQHHKGEIMCLKQRGSKTLLNRNLQLKAVMSVA